MAKILGLQPKTAAIAGGGVLVAAVGYFWWRNRQSKAASSSSSGSSATGCTDGSGNSIPCPDASGIDYSGELSVIQTEVESLLAAEGNEPASSSSGSGGTTGSGTGDKPPGKDEPGAITGLRVTSTTTSGFKAAWRKPAGTTNYRYDVEDGGKVVKSGIVQPAVAAVTVSGLKRNHAYTFFVRACDAHGCGPQASAAVKTRA